MYLHLELKTMATDRLTEAIARLHYLHTLTAASPGFVEAQICEYLGNPAQYLVIRTWTDQQAHVAYRQSAASRDFAASRPAGFIYDNLAVQEWLCVHKTGGLGVGDYVVRELQPVASAGWEAFVAARQRHDAAALQTTGIESLRAYRLLAKEAGSDGDALVLGR